MHPVTTAVGNSRYKSPDCVQPVDLKLVMLYLCMQLYKSMSLLLPLVTISFLGSNKYVIIVVIGNYKFPYPYHCYYNKFPW